MQGLHLVFVQPALIVSERFETFGVLIFIHRTQRAIVRNVQNSNQATRGQNRPAPLTSNVGYPKLREHLGSVVTMMKLSKDWQSFYRTLDGIHPRHGEFQFDFPPDDSGKGL